MADDLVTNDRPKNPGRQEWGRKLGKMSKELKLKKQAADEIIERHHSIFKLKYIVGASALIVGAAALYYQKKRHVAEKQVVETKSRFTAF